MDNYLQKAYCMHQTVRIYAAITTEMVRDVQDKFNMWPTSIQALGRTLTIGAIMSCTYKNDDFINIKVKGDGPVGQIIVEGHDGKVRGCISNPGVFLENNDGSVNVTHGVGAGEIEVIKDLHLRQPCSSSCEIVTRSIVAVAGVASAYDNAVSALLESAENEHRVNSARAGNSYNFYVCGIVKSVGT